MLSATPGCAVYWPASHASITQTRSSGTKTKPSSGRAYGTSKINRKGRFLLVELRREKRRGGTAIAVEGACVILDLCLLLCRAISLSRLRRQLPPGGSLWHKNILLLHFVCFLSPAIAFFEPRDYRVVFFLQKGPHPKMRSEYFCEL